MQITDMYKLGKHLFASPPGWGRMGWEVGMTTGSAGGIPNTSSVETFRSGSMGREEEPNTERREGPSWREAESKISRLEGQNQTKRVARDPAPKAQACRMPLGLTPTAREEEGKTKQLNAGSREALGRRLVWKPSAPSSRKIF